jgi:hypothetical protein
MKLPKLTFTTKVTSGISHWLSPPLTYLTTNDIPADTHLTRISLGVSLGVTVVGVVLLVAPYLAKRLRSVVWLPVLSSVLLVAGIGWGILFGLRYEALFPFDRRVWEYVWFLPVIGFTVYRLRHYKKTIPQHVAVAKRHKHYDKYLPKPKRAH